MSFCRLSFVCALSGTMVLIGSIAAHGQQPPSNGGRKIEFSDPVGSVVASNLNAITKEKTTFQNPEDDLKKPFELFSPGGSLQGISAPPMQRTAPSAADNKRLKEMLQKRQEWIFLKPEDYYTEPTIEEIFGIPEYGSNGEAKEKKSPLGRYYERLERSNTTTNRTRNDGSYGSILGGGGKREGSATEFDFSGAKKDDANEPGDGGDLDSPLKHLLRGNSGNPWATDRTRPTGFSDMFGRQNSEWKPESPEALRAQAARLEEYKRILDLNTMPSSSPISGIAPFDPLKLPASASSTTPTFPFSKNPEPAPVTPVTSVRDSLNPFPSAVGVVGMAARPVGLPEISPSVQGLTPSAPLPEPTRTVVPAPEFNIPKRRF